MVGEVIFMNKQGVQSFDGVKVTQLSQPVKFPVKTDDDRKREFETWFKMKPVYFPTWAWEVACARQPHKYKMFLPIYQGQKVMLT